MVMILMVIYGVLQVVAVAQANVSQRVAAMVPLFIAVPSYVYVLGPFNPDDSIFRGLLFFGSTIFSIVWLSVVVLATQKRAE
jgi:hypothetical protein